MRPPPPSPPTPTTITPSPCLSLRFLSLFMSSSSTSSTTTTPSSTITTTTRHRFPTPHALSEWLKPRLPTTSLSSWGTKPGTKTLHNLWLELSHGEISLSDSSPPVRTVHVAIARVIHRDGRRVLVESEQELSDGTVRSRGRPLSEKMRPNESPEEAVFRAVKEELRVDGEKVRIVGDSWKERVEERCSASYPGLPALYVLHSVDVVVDGLPEEDEFVTDELDEYEDSEETRAAMEGAVFVKKHFWKWVTLDSVKD